MKPAPAAPAGRLVPLTLAVALAHVAILGGAPPSVVQPGSGQVGRFTTRSLAPPAPAVAAAPVPAATTRPAPAPAPRPARAAQPAAEETLAPAVNPARSQAGSETTAAAPEAPAGPETAAAPPPQLAPLIDLSHLPQLMLPAPARFRYEVVASRYGVPLHGEAELYWRHDGEQYEARLEIRSPLLPGRTERSIGRIGEGGLAPSYYARKSRSEQAAHFEREKGTITFSNNRPSAQLSAGVQDRLSVVLQLALLIASNPARFPAGTEIVIPVASTREAETWLFSVEGEEELQLPGGLVQALKLQRKPRKEFDQKVELWLAPRMDYAPVRLRLTSPNGDTVDQRWSSTDKG